MSLRTDMLQAVAKNPGCTLEEIGESIGETDLKRVRNNVAQAKTAGMLTMARDDVTNLPGYTITQMGRARLNTNNDQTGGPRTAAKAQPAVAQNTGSRESDQDLLAEVAAVHETPSGEPAVVSPATDAGRADDTPSIEEQLNRVSFDLGVSEQRLTDALDLINRWEQFGLKLGIDTPDDGDEVLHTIDTLNASRIEQQGIAHQQQLFMRRISSLFGGMGFPEVIDEVSRLVFAHGKPTVTDDAVELTDAATAYLVRVPKRKPRLITKPATAREAALAAVRNGATVATVFALVPVGTARRGAEWTEQQ